MCALSGASDSAARGVLLSYCGGMCCVESVVAELCGESVVSG